MKRALLLVFFAVCALAVFVVAGMAYPASAGRPSDAPNSTSSGAPEQGTPTPTACVTSYTYAVTAGATIVPGTVDIGNHTDDGVTFVTLPFTFSLYGTPYTGVNVGANGNAQFVTTSEEFTNVCLPFAGMGPTIFAYWEDLTTDGANCTGGCGIYISTSGSAPNRIFNIEWRTFYFSEPGNAYFEIRLYEGTSSFDIILGTVNTVATSTIGVQDGAGGFTQYRCNTAPATNSRIAFTAVGGTCSSPTPTFTPGGSTATPTATRTNTPVAATATPTTPATSTNTAVASSTSTPSPTRTATSILPTITVTLVPASATATSSSTAVAPTATPSATSTSQATTEATTTAAPTACTITFTDVDPENVFYSFIRCLACRGIISGYDDGTFRPFNDITRGQIAKIVSNAAGFDEDPGPQVFEDVNDTNPFYQYINRLSNRGHMGGYPCGTVDAEPCIEPDNRPYFRPFANATRGQLAKIVANAANVGGTPTGIFYTDVEEEHPFYLWIMRLTDIGVMSGYDCGGEGEPCDPQNRPYFRPYNNVTRGQASKIVANTFYPGCKTP